MSKNSFDGEFTGRAVTNAELINKRRIINGTDDGLMQISPLKHPWARDIFKNMQRNNWVAEEVPFQKDKEQWENGELTEQEKQTFLRALEYLPILIRLNSLINLNNLNKNVSLTPDRNKGRIANKSIKVQKLKIYLILPDIPSYFFV